MKKRNAVRRKRNNYKGIGWISIILFIFVGSLVVGGFLFLPSSKRTPITREYITISDENCSGDNLHLCTFRIVTVTPSPRPTWDPENAGGGDDGGGDDGGSSDPIPPPGNGGAVPL